MNSVAISGSTLRTRLLLPILVGGALAGTFDLTSAFITLGPKNPLLIAGGLLGKQALRGGAGTWILGVVLHYSIAFGSAAIYCISSRKLPFLKEHWLVCGLFFGIAIYLVMNLVVLPICAYHYMGPYQYKNMVQGILIHMTIIGLPIAFCLRRLS
ncbi:MAG TPA: hypothetical protein VFB43_04100 [Terracidiphilus sp.]|nr:hypothetical protein [Terracidiphilus sp.]